MSNGKTEIQRVGERVRSKNGFLLRVFNPLRLAWRLIWDRRVNLWLKLFLVLLPVGYAAVPLPDDILPVVGILDDILFVGLCLFVFVAISPTALVAEHRNFINGVAGDPSFDLEAHRYPSEQRDLALGFAIGFIGLTLGGWLAGLVGVMVVLLGYWSSRIARSRALSNAVQVTGKQFPHLHKVLLAACSHLPSATVEMFVTQNPSMNAYCFGFSEPHTVILTSGLVERLNEAEIQAIIGHELGHIHFGHVRMINLMSGFGTPVGWLFYRWRRACEYSCDAIALLATGGELQPVVSSFLKLASGLADVSVDLDAFLEQEKQESGNVTATAELTSTHPFINHRIRNLIRLKETGRFQEASV